MIWDLDFENRQAIKFKKDNEKEERTDFLVGKPIKSLHGHNHFISSLALSSDSKKLISGSWDKTARLWDLPTYTSQRILAGHTKDVLAVSFSENERVIFTGSMDKSLKYWNTQGVMKYSSSAFKGWITCIANFRKEKELFMAVGCMDGDVRILDHDYTIIRTIPGEGYGVTSISPSDEGDFIFVSYKNGVVKLFSVATGPDQTDVEKQKFEINVDVNAVNFQSCYFGIIALGTSTGIQFRSVKTKELLYSNENIPSSACLSICYDSSKKYVFAGHADGTIRVYQISPSA